MTPKRRILIVGGGTAGWLTAAHLAKALRLAERPHLELTVLESPDIGIVGVGEGTFPTIRTTLQFLGISEPAFIRDTAATFKQGIRFMDWGRAPGAAGERHAFFHPFEAPYYAEDLNLVPYWLLQDEAAREPFARAVTLQQRVAEAQRAPKRAGEAPFAAPLNYAYHFDAFKLARLLAERARQLGVHHVQGTVTDFVLDERGAIARLETAEAGRFEADLYVDCTGFRAELIGRALGSGFKSARRHLFADRALACKLPDPAPDDPDAPLESCTIATAHEAGWLWDIALNGARGIGCVYSSDHLGDERAAEILRGYAGPASRDLALRSIPFAPGYRERQWVKNCVAVGLSAGFLEPLESTGLVLIEAAVGMIAEMLPHSGPMEAPARRFNELMTTRFDNIINFLKLHYCLSGRSEPFWRDNAEPATLPERLAELLEQWRLRPPGRFDFVLDTETFAFFNYQYILYGMGWRTDLGAAREDFPQAAQAERLFAKIHRFADRAVADLPSHRSLIRQINAGAPPAR
ncbi:tryptophan halogenase family protein [Roseateles sp.]|uniref:tryptophan halogenase family protein n=1 Tax=Roseateles sp. TaxID=1971397 RepID=UPI002E0431CE|nr:tryptophan halogenase family protein [Roseateles sp.]